MGAQLDFVIAMGSNLQHFSFIYLPEVIHQLHQMALHLVIEDLTGSLEGSVDGGLILTVQIELLNRIAVALFFNADCSFLEMKHTLLKLSEMYSKSIKLFLFRLQSYNSFLASLDHLLIIQTHILCFFDLLAELFATIFYSPLVGDDLLVLDVMAND